jgi:predicted DNA-binding protein with PD1-like motif
MKSRRFDKYVVIRLEKDEEIIATLTRAVQEKEITGGFLYGLGVGKDLELGYFDAHKHTYIRKKFDDEYEFTSLLGNISSLNGETIVHCHVTITDRQFRAFGGHLFRGTVPATLEVIVIPFSEPLNRKLDEITSLNLLDM